MKGMDSMSPTVPPSSMTHTSGLSGRPSTGSCATRSIQSCQAATLALMAAVLTFAMSYSPSLPGEKLMQQGQAHLDCVRDVWHHLHRLTQVIAPPLSLDHRLQ